MHCPRRSGNQNLASGSGSSFGLRTLSLFGCRFCDRNCPSNTVTGILIGPLPTCVCCDWFEASPTRTPDQPVSHNYVGNQPPPISNASRNSNSVKKKGNNVNLSTTGGEVAPLTYVRDECYQKVLINNSVEFTPPSWVRCLSPENVERRTMPTSTKGTISIYSGDQGRDDCPRLNADVPGGRDGRWAVVLL